MKSHERTPPVSDSPDLACAWNRAETIISLLEPAPENSLTTAVQSGRLLRTRCQEIPVPPFDTEATWPWNRLKMNRSLSQLNFLFWTFFCCANQLRTNCCWRSWEKFQCTNLVQIMQFGCSFTDLFGTKKGNLKKKGIKFPFFVAGALPLHGANWQHR